MKKIAVITAYNNEEFRLIEKANHSVVSQSNNEVCCDHIIVVDGFDLNKNLEKIKCKKVELNQNHNDNGNTPRSVGTNMAISQPVAMLTVYLPTLPLCIALLIILVLAGTSAIARGCLACIPTPPATTIESGYGGPASKFQPFL